LRAPTTGLARYDQDARIFQSSKHAHYHLLARHAASAFELHGAEDWPLKQNIEQGYRVLRMGNADDFLSETSGSAAARGTRSKPAKNSTRAQRFRPQLN